MRWTVRAIAIGLLSGWAVGVATAAIWSSSFLAAIVYLILAAAGGFVVVRYCRAMRSAWRDAIVAGGLVAILLVLPQFWLIGDLVRTLAFWAPVVLISLIASQTSCPACTNPNCPLRRWRA